MVFASLWCYFFVCCTFDKKNSDFHFEFVRLLGTYKMKNEIFEIFVFLIKPAGNFTYKMKNEILIFLCFQKIKFKSINS